MKNEDLNFLAMMGTTSTNNSTPNTSAKEEQCHEKEKINNNVPKNDSVNDNANGNSNGSDTKNGNSKGKSHGNSKGHGKHLPIKKEQGNTNGNTNGSSTSTITSASTDTNTSTDDDENTMIHTKNKKKVYLTRLFLSFTVLVFVTSRASMSSFCHFDESKESYIIRYSQEIKPGVNSSSNVNTNKENCPPIKTANLDQSKSKHKNKQLSQTLCQSSHLILDYMALIVHPYIDYHTILPKSILQKHPDAITSNTDTSSCGCDSDERKKKKKIRNPISIFKKLGKVFKKGKKNKRKVIASDSDSNSDNTSSGAASGGDDDDDWTLYVSQSPELILSTQQSDIMQKTGANFIERLEKQKEEEENNTNADADVRLKNMFWGGEGASGRMASFPWWFPPGTNLEKSKKNQESSGSRLLASYLKIMKWPKNLVTQFPGGVCTDGCPTDFALAHTLEFREKFKPWAITPSAMDENKKGWFYVRGYSPTRYHASNEQGGSCVLWYRPEFQIKNSKTIEQQARVLVHGIDTCVGDALYRSNGKIGKCNIVLDANNFGLSNIPSMSATKKILTMLQDHFPDRLGVFVIANMAKPAQIFLKMVMPLVPVEVRRKIHVLPSDAEERGNMLKSLVEERFIPTRLGGQDNYVFDANEYYKTGKYKSDFITNEEGIEYVKTMPHHA